MSPFLSTIAPFSPSSHLSASDQEKLRNFCPPHPSLFTQDAFPEILKRVRLKIRPSYPTHTHFLHTPTSVYLSSRLNDKRVEELDRLIDADTAEAKKHLEKNDKSRVRKDFTQISKFSPKLHRISKTSFFRVCLFILKSI